MNRNSIQRKSKLPFKKLQISRLTDLSYIKGGNNNHSVVNCDDDDTGMGDISEPDN